MRNWNLGIGDPLSLTLAADSRLAQLDYTDDHIWELRIGHSDLAGVVLHTTYGLRARHMRIFPQFTEKHITVSNPADFDTPPTLVKFYPNYLQVNFSPFAGIDVQMEYWAPDSCQIAGRIRLSNNGVTDRKFQFDLVGLLSPDEGGQPMLPEQREAVHILQGKTGALCPTIFITGGAAGVSSPYPTLRHDLHLLPGSFRQFTWVQTAPEDPVEAFTTARQTATRRWEAELARIELTNAQQVEIFTGDPDWDAAFALGQKAAYTLLHSPTQHLPHTSFVSTRQPDQGFSPRGDGSDYNHLWNGQTALEAWYLSELLLPGGESLITGLLKNFLQSQGNDWRVDWKPGLAGQRSGMLAMPLLADLAWRCAQHMPDPVFLQELYTPLLEFAHTWFHNQQDRDGDGIPEWDNPVQSGFEDNPTFAHWQPWAQGTEISLVESPDLCAYIYSECQALIKIANLLGREESIAALQAFSDNLVAAVETAYNPRTASYNYWDRDTHQSPKGELLKSRKGPGEIFLDIIFELPVRLMLRFETVDGETPLKTSATVHGMLGGSQHRVERITRSKIRWMHGHGRVTLDNLYAELEHIQIEGLPPDATVEVHIVDYRAQDQTQLVPLWAKIPSQERAEKIIARKLDKPTQYRRPHGLPACPMPPKHKDAEVLESVWLPWNVMVGEALLAYGHRDKAVDLVTRIMTGITSSLKREQCFRKHYHMEKEVGLGERDALLGLPPIHLFLEALGVRILSPWKVFIHGFNLYPWPVKIKYRGLLVECDAEEVAITFPDGNLVVVTEGSAPCTVDGDARQEPAA